jgi:YfiH family protein
LKYGASVSTLFTTRAGGVSQGAFASLNLALHVGDAPADVQANRAIAARDLGRVQYMNQVHGNRVVIVEEFTEAEPTADALVTGIPGLHLAVMVADCIPLLLSSDVAVAAVHVGRRGLINDVTRSALHAMREIGAEKISAIVGPSICGRCYEVSEDVYSEVTNLHPLAASRTAKDTFALDLPAALHAVLASESVAIVDDFSCTFEDLNLFSYRRDGITGRQAGIISL